MSLYVDHIKLVGKKQNLDQNVESIQHSSLTTSIWIALNENVKKAKMLSTITEICLSPESLQEQKKNYIVQGNLAQTSAHGPMIWILMQRNVWSGIASWPIKQLSNHTKFQFHALMTIISKKKKRDLSDNCQKSALKSSCNACIWNALVVETFCACDKRCLDKYRET